MTIFNSEEIRENQQDYFGEKNNPIGLNGIEFIEYSSKQPQALAQLLENLGFCLIARHRSREVLLYSQGQINIIINAEFTGDDLEQKILNLPEISAIAFRVNNAKASFKYLLDKGGYEAPVKPEAMELYIPAIYGVGGTKIYLIDRYQDFSIFDIDFVKVDKTVNLKNKKPLIDFRFFGLVQYIGNKRSSDWLTFYESFFGALKIPDEKRFGIMPTGKLIQIPAKNLENSFLIQLIESKKEIKEKNEKLESEFFQRIGFGVKDVLKTVEILKSRGIEFIENDETKITENGAVTKTYLGNILFELVHDYL